MVKSMTAFGRGRLETESKTVTVEIKSVNSRYFDCNVKMPRAYLFMEEKIKGYLQKNAVSRAKVDVYITVQYTDSDDTVITLDRGAAEGYLKALYELRDTFGLKDDISVMSVARNQELFRTEKAELDPEREWLDLVAALDIAIKDYNDMRKKEGKKIFADLEGKIEGVRHLTEEIEAISAKDTVGYRDKLESRLRAILADNSVTVDENRLLTECAVWADKIAIDEELVRLRSHFDAFYDISDGSEPSGRKLDFLMQEMNREINTTGSKCSDAQIAHLVVDVKCELEKIREQIQNLE